MEGIYNIRVNRLLLTVKGTGEYYAMKILEINSRDQLQQIGNIFKKFICSLQKKCKTNQHICLNFNTNYNNNYCISSYSLYYRAHNSPPLLVQEDIIIMQMNTKIILS